MESEAGAIPPELSEGEDRRGQRFAGLSTRWVTGILLRASVVTDYARCPTYALLIIEDCRRSPELSILTVHRTRRRRYHARETTDCRVGVRPQCDDRFCRETPDGMLTRESALFGRGVSDERTWGAIMQPLQMLGTSR